MKYFLSVVLIALALTGYLLFLMITAQAIPLWLTITLITLIAIIAIWVLIVMILFFLVMSFFAELGVAFMKAIFHR